MSVRYLYVFLIVAMFPLSSCSLLPPLQDNQKQYIIGEVPSVSPARKTHRRLLINHPVTNAAYDTARMAYSPRQWEINYFSKNRWSDKPADMLQSLIIRTFEQSGAFTAVSGSPLPGGRDLVLNSEIIQFEEDLTGTQPVFRFGIRIELHQGDLILLSKQFKIVQPVIIQSPYAVVKAANLAVSKALYNIENDCMHIVYAKGQ